MNLKQLAKDSGKLIDIKKGLDVTISKCEEICEENERCFSFNFCKKKNKCYFFDKKLDGLEELQEPNECFTSYKKCKSGKWANSILEINLHRITLCFNDFNINIQIKLLTLS